MGEVYILVSGFQLAIFLSLLMMSFLIKKDKVAKIFRLIAFLFVIMAIFDFVHVFANIYGQIWPWIAQGDNLFLITHPVVFINGILFIFLLKNLKDKKK